MKCVEGRESGRLAASCDHRCDRQIDGELGSVAFGTGGFDRPAVCSDELPGDGQAQPTTGAWAACPSFIAFPESVENMGQCVCWNALSVVPDHDPGLAIDALQDELYLPAFGGVPEGVGNQISKHLLQAFVVCCNGGMLC